MLNLLTEQNKALPSRCRTCLLLSYPLNGHVRAGKENFPPASNMTSTLASVNTGSLSCLVASLDGSLLASGNEEGVDVWAVGSGESTLLLVRTF